MPAAPASPPGALPRPGSGPPPIDGLLVGLVRSCHPIPSAGVTVISVLLSLAVGLPATTVTAIGFAVLAGQLSIGWSNDRLDLGRDAATARTDKPAALGRVSPTLLTVAAGLALAAAVVLSLLVGGRAAVAVLVLVAAGWSYNLGLKAGVLSGLTYAIGFGALPTAPYFALDPGRCPAWWVPVTGALIGVGAHVANVLPDLDDDEATGVRGLPHRLGRHRSILLLAASLGSASVVLGFGPSRPPAQAVGAAVLGLLVSIAVAVAARRRPDSPLAFRLVIALAIFDIALVVSLAG